MIKKIYNQPMNFINQLLENIKKEKCILHLEIIFGVLIQLICNYCVNLVKDLHLRKNLDISGKYTWVIPLKDKKFASIVNAFQQI